MPKIENFENICSDREVYATDRGTDGDEISKVIDHIVQENMGNPKRIIVLTGTHGDEHGNPSVPDKSFFVEDKYKELQYLTAVNVTYETSRNTWKRYFDQKKSVIILAWCHSKRWDDLDGYLE